LRYGPADQMIGLIWLLGWVAAYVAHALGANWNMGPQSVWRAGDVSLWGPTKGPIGYVQRKENKRRARHDAYAAGGGGHEYLGEFPSRRDAIHSVHDYDKRGDAIRGQPVASQPARGPSTRLTAELERLASLHTDGALTDEEFAAAKARVLSQDY
jgi:Short C-terminal domain